MVVRQVGVYVKTHSSKIVTSTLRELHLADPMFNFHDIHSDALDLPWQPSSLSELEHLTPVEGLRDTDEPIQKAALLSGDVDTHNHSSNNDDSKSNPLLVKAPGEGQPGSQRSTADFPAHSDGVSTSDNHGAPGLYPSLVDGAPLAEVQEGSTKEVLIDDRLGDVRDSRVANLDASYLANSIPHLTGQPLPYSVRRQRSVRDSARSVGRRVSVESVSCDVA